MLQSKPQQKGKQPVDSLAWNKKYEVLSISRFYLHHSLGFSAEAVESLTDEDMQWIADVLIAHYFDHEFDEEVKFVALHALKQEQTRPQPSEEGEQTHG
jgi:hypothetical protein